MTCPAVHSRDCLRSREEGAVIRQLDQRGDEGCFLEEENLELDFKARFKTPEGEEVGALSIVAVGFSSQISHI